MALKPSLMVPHNTCKAKDTLFIVLVIGTARGLGDMGEHSSYEHFYVTVSSTLTLASLTCKPFSFGMIMNEGLLHTTLIPMQSLPTMWSSFPSSTSNPRTQTPCQSSSLPYLAKQLSKLIAARSSKDLVLFIVLLSTCLIVLDRIRTPHHQHSLLVLIRIQLQLPVLTHRLLQLFPAKSHWMVQAPPTPMERSKTMYGLSVLIL